MDRDRMRVAMDLAQQQVGRLGDFLFEESRSRNGYVWTNTKTGESEFVSLREHARRCLAPLVGTLGFTPDEVFGMTDVPFFDQFRNAGGTYDGAAMFAVLTGLSKAEVMWTFERMKALQAGGMSDEAAKAVVLEESKDRPWQKA